MIVFIVSNSLVLNSFNFVKGKVFNGNIVSRFNNGDRRIMVIIPDCGSGDGGSIPPDCPSFHHH